MFARRLQMVANDCHSQSADTFSSHTGILQAHAWIPSIVFDSICAKCNMGSNDRILQMAVIIS